MLEETARHGLIRLSMVEKKCFRSFLFVTKSREKKSFLAFSKLLLYILRDVCSKGQIYEHVR